MYKCNDCEYVFECPDGIEEKVGEYCGQPAYEVQDVCPNCGSYDFQEVYQCRITGEYYADDEMSGDVADWLIDTKRFDYEYCKEICKGETQKVEINVLAASLLTEREINIILMHELDNYAEIAPVDCQNLIDSDRSWFAEKMVERHEANNKEKQRSIKR